MVTYTLKVSSIRRETEDTITLCFKQPALRKVKYKAGQYLSLIFRINGRRYIRPYSFSSAPHIDPTLDITVKRVQNGIVSNHIHDVVCVGDSIEVLSPMGDFTYENKDSSQDQVFLWGVGSGITPLISLTKQILAEYPHVNVNLVYGNRNHESTIFLSLINELAASYADRFKVWHFHTQFYAVQEYPFLLEGRITKERILSIIQGVKAEQSLHYICGPLSLKESIKNVLFSLNVSENNILSEDFEIIKDPKDFVDIQTQVVHLNFSGKSYDLEVVKGKTVLESALDAGIELPYSCQTGNCNTCVAKLKSGKLRMIGLNKIREDLLADEFLLCCSHPLTSDIGLEV